MYHSALMARDAFLEEHPGAMTIEVIDSNCYTVGYGYPLMQACKKAQQGAEFEEVVAYIRDYLDRVRIYFSPFTLQYVKNPAGSAVPQLCRGADWSAPGYFGSRNHQCCRKGARQCSHPFQYGKDVCCPAQ